MTTPVEEYFRRNGLQFTRRNGKNGPELVFDCPSCGRKGKASVNASTWMWHCFHADCAVKGGEHSLKKAHGLVYDVPGPSGHGTWEDYQTEALARALASSASRSEVESWREALRSSPEAEQGRAYLLSRGLTLETAAAVGLGWAAKVNGIRAPGGVRRWRGNPEAQTVTPGWITIPAFTRWAGGEPDWTSAAMVKARRVPYPGADEGQKYARITGGESILYQPGKLDPDKTLVIVGGEIDAISCWQAGWTNVVSPTNGEGAWSPIWTRQLEPFGSIVVIYDNDSAGVAGAKAVVDALGAHRTKVASWPEGFNDANAAMLALGEEFDEAFIASLVKAATSESIDGVYHVDSLRTAFMEHLDADSIHGRETGWPDLDALIGGLRAAEVTVVTGDTGSGKTTLTSQVALHWSIFHGGVLYCPFEMGVKKQLRKWMTQITGKLLADQTRAEVSASYDLLERTNLLMFWRSEVNPEALYNTIVYVARNCGVSLVVIDHLHWLLREDSDSVKEIERYTKAIARAAVESGVHILLVAHPHAVKGEGRNRDNAVVQLADLKGASAIKQDADNAWSCWRPRTAERSVDEDENGLSPAVIYSLKQRDEMGEEGSCALSFDKASARFLGHSEPMQGFLPEADRKPAPTKGWSPLDRGQAVINEARSRLGFKIGGVEPAKEET